MQGDHCNVQLLRSSEWKCQKSASRFTKKSLQPPLRPILGCVLRSKHKMREHYHHVKMQNDCKIHCVSLHERFMIFVCSLFAHRKKSKFTRNVKISFWVSREIKGRAVTQASHQSCCFKHKMSAVNILSYTMSLTDPNWSTLHIMSTVQTDTIFFSFMNVCTEKNAVKIWLALLSSVSTRIWNYLGLLSVLERQNMLHLLLITKLKRSAFEWICECLWIVQSNSSSEEMLVAPF